MSHDSRATSPALGSAAIGARDPGSIDATVVDSSDATAGDDAAAIAGPPSPAVPGAGPGGAAGEEPLSPVVTASFSIQGFVDGWIHCQHVADYLARFAASDRFDPEQLTTRLSTYLNEALELVFRCHEPAGPRAGELVIAIHRGSDRLQIELRCPLAGGGDRLRRSVERAAGPEVAAAYRRDFAALLTADADDDAEEEAGLLELVALHGITLALDGADGADAVVLCMTVPHE